MNVASVLNLWKSNRATEHPFLGRSGVRYSLVLLIHFSDPISDVEEIKAKPRRVLKSSPILSDCSFERTGSASSDQRPQKQQPFLYDMSKNKQKVPFLFPRPYKCVASCIQDGRRRNRTQARDTQRKNHSVVIPNPFTLYMTVYLISKA